MNEVPEPCGVPSLAEQLEKLTRDSRAESAYAGRMERALEHIRLICRLARNNDIDRQDLFEALDVIEDHSKVKGPVTLF